MREAQAPPQRFDNVVSRRACKAVIQRFPLSGPGGSCCFLAVDADEDSDELSCVSAGDLDPASDDEALEVSLILGLANSQVWDVAEPDSSPIAGPGELLTALGNCFGPWVQLYSPADILVRNQLRVLEYCCPTLTAYALRLVSSGVPGDMCGVLDPIEGFEGMWSHAVCAAV